jgi:hypothetical protein
MADISQRDELERYTKFYLDEPNVKEQIEKATSRLAP